MKRFGLPKESLLGKPYEYSRVYRKGNRLKGQGFSLIFLTNDFSHSRLGISVHRLIRGAVHRNRIKRIIREVFRLHFDLFPESCDIVFTVAPGFSFHKADTVREAVAGLAKR